MIKPPKGIKLQALGSVLFCLGVMTALLARAIGFELDMFYVVIGIAGACLFLYGSIQKYQHKKTKRTQPVDRLGAEPDATDMAHHQSVDFTA